MWCADLLHKLGLLGVTALGLLQSTCAGAQTSSSADTSQVPSDYYSSADGKQGKALKMALGDITRQHTIFGYNELWYHYEVTDVVPGTENQVFDYYSPVVHYFTGTGAAPDGMNKEHACPQSWWGSGAVCAAYSDLFNVMPSESGANSAKSNYPLGVVGNASYTNARMKVGPSSRSEYSGNVFEPCDEFKGDFARLYFYVATCYADADWGIKESVAQTVAFQREDYPTIKPWLLSLLLQWNALDPVSDWEITRNECVYAEQGNRNPYIDYPQLADYVWGDSIQFAFDLSKAVINGTGSGHGAGFTPGDEPGNTDDPGNTPGGSTDQDDEPAVGEYGIGNVLLNESFSSVLSGSDSDNSNSSEPWLGNENFPEVDAAFQAGGAVRLGSSKRIGFLTSCSLNNVAGAKLLVVIKVKGWTSVEGDLLVSLSGQNPKTVSYTATMKDDYQTVTLQFDDCQADAKLHIETSTKRAFVTLVRVGTPVGESALTQIHSEARPEHLAYNLLGQPVAAGTRGLQIRQGHLIFY